MNLQLELAKSKAAIYFVEGEIKWMEAKFAMDQVEHIYGILKLALTAYEIRFMKCKSLAKQLFLGINTDLLEIMPPNDSEILIVAVNVADKDNERLSQVRDDDAFEVHNKL